MSAPTEHDRIELVSTERLERELTAVRGAAVDPLSGVFGPCSMTWLIDREAAIFLGAGRDRRGAAGALWRHSMMRAVSLFSLFAGLTGAAFAHHGWGSYDANNPVTVTGPIVTSKFENPHATITVRTTDKVWTVTLAPTSRMNGRGATEKIVAVGFFCPPHPFDKKISF
jgi:hypothetical protein